MARSLFNLAVLACLGGASARRFEMRHYALINTTSSLPCSETTSSVESTSSGASSTFSTFSWTNTSSTVPPTSVTSSSVTLTESLTSESVTSVSVTSSEDPVITTSSASGTVTSSTSGSESDVTSSYEASITSSVELTTSTVYTTTVRTVTKCPPYVVDCPSNGGYVTTETIPWYTTVCPVTGTSGSPKPPKPTNPPAHGPETITTTFHTTYTITKCPGSVPNCPVGSVTTEVVTTTYCPGNGEPVPSGPAGEHPSGPGEHPEGPKPTGPAGHPEQPEHPQPSGPAGEHPEVPEPTGPAGHPEVPKPSGPGAEQPPVTKSETGYHTVPTGAHSTVVVPPSSGFDSSTIPSKPTSTPTPPATTPPVSGGAKVGVSAVALFGVVLAMM
ncbi:hypothetical protein HJFPF1_02517 [Paramyrothecium foliicola]|nr:hypothetical protein HJFPF1_02517 [Paramyrothecium foliicola]